MSHAGYTCDRCGNNGAAHSAAWLRGTKRQKDAWLDLCDSCAGELRAWKHGAAVPEHDEGVA